VLSGDGAAAFYNVGVLKALEEAEIQPAIVVGTGLSSYIAALYATGHSVLEIEETCRRLAALLSEGRSNSALDEYVEDSGVYREMATHLLRYDTAGLSLDSLPVRLLLIGQDMNSNQRMVFNEGSILTAVRATLGSGLTVAPFESESFRIMSVNFPWIAVARNEGADLVIAVNIRAIPIGTGQRESRTEDQLRLAQSFELAAVEIQTLMPQDLVIVPGFLASDDFDDYDRLLSKGYADTLERIAAGKFPSTGRSISFAAVKKLPPEKMRIGSVAVINNEFIPNDLILKQLDLKAGNPFSASSILAAIDRALASGYYRSVHFDYRIAAESRNIIFIVKEAQKALPMESLPRLEAAIRNAARNPALAIRATASIEHMRPVAKPLVPALVDALQVPSTNLRRAILRALAGLRELSVDALSPLRALAAETEVASLRTDAIQAMSTISLAAAAAGLTEKLPQIVAARNTALEFKAGSETLMTFNLAIERLDSLATANATRLSAIKLDDVSLLAGKAHVKLNGVDTPVEVDVKDNTVKFLGDSADLQQGLNIIDSTRFWLEERKLQAYESPYKNSYAIVVAISDYARTKDPRKRGKTGFAEVPQMVPEAKKLIATLQRVGFPAKNILTLFDQDATSDRMEAVLQRFWQGGDLADADRLFVYFGGHGSVADSTPILVTYDYDEKRPTTTSFQMQDLVERQSRSLRPHHVLFALDACHAGLTAKHLGESNAEKAQFLRFRTLAAIRRDAEPRARNLLVAGTGDQLALYKNGGLFTRALVESLAGGGDLNKDGVIQMEELAFSVRNWVTENAGREMERQDPDYKVLDTYGTGRFMFLTR